MWHTDNTLITRQGVLATIKWAKEVASTFWDDDCRQLVIDIILATRYLEIRQSLPLSFRSAILAWLIREERTDLVEAIKEMERRSLYQDVTSDEILSMILDGSSDIDVYVFMAAFQHLLNWNEINDLSVIREQKRRRLNLTIVNIEKTIPFHDSALKFN